MEERLQKILSACGAASRREAEKMIMDGRVTVNGRPAVTGQKADAEKDDIRLDGKSLWKPDKLYYVMLHKPRGYVTTMHDEKDRPTVQELTAEIGVRLYPIGRLDMDSEGLLLMTNDGEFANMVGHPSAGKAKTYHVTVVGDVSRAVEPLGKSFLLDGVRTRPAKVELLKETDSGGVLSISITEGRNRQIRRMCSICGLKVKRLVRVSIGDVHLGHLKSGAWRNLTSRELASLGKKE